jgi:hypothetical protein
MEEDGQHQEFLGHGVWGISHASLHAGIATCVGFIHAMTTPYSLMSEFFF